MSESGASCCDISRLSSFLLSPCEYAWSTIANQNGPSQLAICACLSACTLEVAPARAGWLCRSRRCGGRLARMAQSAAKRTRPPSQNTTRKSRSEAQKEKAGESKDGKDYKHPCVSCRVSVYWEGDNKYFRVRLDVLHLVPPLSW